MKIVAISDTHGKHGELILPPGDVLIHAGDVSMNGTRAEIQDFLEWFSTQKFTHKIFIAGNHDFFLEQAAQDEIECLIPEGVTYLKDSGVSLDGLKVWGSPVTPWFYNWAFNRFRGAAIKRHWDMIPDDTDILVTHGPCFPDAGYYAQRNACGL